MREPSPPEIRAELGSALAARGARTREFVAVLRRRGWILAACAVLIPAAAYLIVALQPRQHRASVIVQPSPLVPSSVIVSRDVPAGWFLSPSPYFVALLARTPPVTIAAARLVHRSPAALGFVSASADNKTGWATIEVTASTGRSAMNAANAVATAVGTNLQLRTRKAIAALQGGFQQRLSQERDATKRRELAAQLKAFSRFRPDRQPTIQVIQPAVEARTVSNHPELAAVLALIPALLLGAWLVRLAERADRRIRGPEEVERVAGAPLLAAVPGGGRTSPEPFLRLRDAIVYLSGQRARSTVVVASPRRGEGRTSVATGLANAFAASGRSVVLVDADLRNPQVASHLGLPTGRGLAEVLSGDDLEAVLHVLGGAGTGLTVLAAGSPGPESPDLLASERMASVMRQLSEKFDVVVLDTPPLLAASDALPLLPYASGVVVLAQIDHTSGKALGRAVQILKDAGANVLGPVATRPSPRSRRVESSVPSAPGRKPALHAPGG